MSSSSRSCCKGIVLAYFDNRAGPKIAIQTKPCVLQDEQFDAISDYCITKPSLAHKLISVNAFGLTILGFPVCLQNTKYQRNALLFNLCFVFALADASAARQIASFEPIVRKFATVLATLEQESEFLFRALFADSTAPPAANPPSAAPVAVGAPSSDTAAVVPINDSSDDTPTSTPSTSRRSGLLGASRHTARAGAGTTVATATTATAPSVHSNAAFAQLASLIDQVFAGLNDESGSVQLHVDDANVLALRLFPTLSDDSTVLEHHVPVRIQPLELLINKHWDLTLLRIVPFINGIYHVRKIATEANVNVGLVVRSLTLLVHYRLVKLVDIFQYSNVYMPTRHINRLYTNQALQRECVSSVALMPRTPETKPFSWQDVFRIYCALRPPRTMRDMCLAQPLLGTSIDERKLVTFGVLHGLIRRIHSCPFAEDSKAGVAAAQFSTATSSSLARRARPMLDGQTSYDAICCALQWPKEDIHTALLAEQVRVYQLLK
jgi:hypothetical protein